MDKQLYKWADDYDHLPKKERKRWKVKDYLAMRYTLAKYFPVYDTTTLLYISYLEHAKEKMPQLQVIIDCLDENRPEYSIEQDHFESLNVDVWNALIPFNESK